MPSIITAEQRRLTDRAAPCFPIYGQPPHRYIANNTISDQPHTSITGGGNDNLFEYNTIKHSCYETIDTGAFYVGRSWSQRGNVVRCRLPGILAHMIAIDFLSRLPTTVIGHIL